MLGIQIWQLVSGIGIGLLLLFGINKILKRNKKTNKIWIWFSIIPPLMYVLIFFNASILHYVY